MKIANEVDKEFVMEAEIEHVVLEFVMIDKIDGVNESDRIDKHKRIALS